MNAAVPTKLLITAENADSCSALFGANAQPQAGRLDFSDLTLEVDWSRKRTLWLVHGVVSPEDLGLIFEKITPCSRVILVMPPHQQGPWAEASASERVQDWLSEERLSIVMGGEMEQQIAAIDGLIDIDNFDGWKPILTNAFLEAHSEHLQTFYRKLAAQINIKMMMKNTHLEKSVSFLKNALINAPLANGQLKMAQFVGALKNKPALIVAAGPSLNKQMETLAQNKDLFTIFAVDRVWPILKKHGITPDVVVSLDPSSKPSWPDNAIDDETLFMVDLGSSPELVWSHNKNHLFTSCNPDVNAVLKTLGVEVEHMSTGGSVATTAFSIALTMGANPIVLIGQDLALTGGQAYAEGYMNKPNAEYLKQQYDSGFDIVGYNGETVRTDRQLLFYKTWFENRIKALPAETMVINSTEGGACIEGALQIPFRLVCEELSKVQIPKIPLISLQDTSIEKVHLQILMENIFTLAEKINVFQRLADKGSKIVQARTRQSISSRLLKIDGVNKELLDFDRRVKFVVDVFAIAKLESIRYQASTMETANAMRDSLKKYGEVYQSILDSSELALLAIEKIQGLYSRCISNEKIDARFISEILEIK